MINRGGARGGGGEAKNVQFRNCSKVVGGVWSIERRERGHPRLGAGYQLQPTFPNLVRPLPPPKKKSRGIQGSALLCMHNDT